MAMKARVAQKCVVCGGILYGPISYCPYCGEAVSGFPLDANPSPINRPISSFAVENPVTPLKPALSGSAKVQKSPETENEIPSRGIQPASSSRCHVEPDAKTSHPIRGMVAVVAFCAVILLVGALLKFKTSHAVEKIRLEVLPNSWSQMVELPANARFSITIDGRVRIRNGHQIYFAEPGVTYSMGDALSRHFEFKSAEPRAVHVQIFFQENK